MMKQSVAGRSQAIMETSPFSEQQLPEIGSSFQKTSHGCFIYLDTIAAIH